MSQHPSQPPLRCGCLKHRRREKSSFVAIESRCLSALPTLPALLESTACDYLAVEPYGLSQDDSF